MYQKRITFTVLSTIFLLACVGLVSAGVGQDMDNNVLVHYNLTQNSVPYEDYRDYLDIDLDRDGAGGDPTRYANTDSNLPFDYYQDFNKAGNEWIYSSADTTNTDIYGLQNFMTTFFMRIGTASATNNLMGYFTRISNVRYGYVLTLDSGSNLDLAIWNNTARTATYTAWSGTNPKYNLTSGVWYHIALRYHNSVPEIWINGSKYGNIYVNSTVGVLYGYNLMRNQIGNTLATGSFETDRDFDGDLAYFTFFNSTDLEYINNSRFYSFPFVESILANFSFATTNPSQNVRDNQDLSMNYSVTGSDAVNVTCELYIDSVLNDTQTSVSADTVYTFSPGWVDGYYQWYIECENEDNDVITTSTYQFNKDTSDPFIQSGSPTVFNTTVFTNDTMNIVGNITDNSIFRVNRTIFYPNGTVYYNNYSGNLTVNTTLYSWDDTFDTSLMPNGYYTMFIESADSHTNKYFPDALFVNKNQGDRKLTFGFADNTIQVSLVGGNVLGQFESINTTKLEDRYTFELDFRNTITPNSRMIFRVESESPLNYLSGSDYPAHMVTGDYWLDFAGVEGNFDVNCFEYANEEQPGVDCMAYDVEITTANGADKFVFESLGGLNEDNITIQFEIDNCIPSWVCSGYAACNISDLAPCNAVTDNNACGEAYTGNYSEFVGQACNYCSYSLSLVSLGTCNATTLLSLNLYEDLSFGTCCNITGLGSDCAFANQSQGYVNESCETGYSAQYSTGDVSLAFLDGFAIVIITFVSMAGIVILFVFFEFLYKRLRGIRR